MTVEEFLTAFQDILQRDEAINLDANLEDIEEWDSMSVMACMVWLDAQFNCKYSFQDIAMLQSVRELIALTNGIVS